MAYGDSHHYTRLIQRLNRFPLCAPPGKYLYRILRMLFSEKEARYVSLLPIKPFTSRTASGIWKTGRRETKQILNTLADRGILLDIEQNGEACYVLPPPMAGFFEFSMMRVRQDINQKALAELFYQYLNEEEAFIRDLFSMGQTRLGRVFVNESIIPEDHAVYVLDYEKASSVIQEAGHISISLCYCRHKMANLNRSCKAPLNICMTFNRVAASLIKHGIGRSVCVSECMDLLQKAYDYNLVQFGENIRDQVHFICNCCGCCCEAMLAAKRFASYRPIHTSNFIAVIDSRTCMGCGQCVAVCPINAIELTPISSDHDSRKHKARINPDLCLGCGVCVRNCRMNSISMDRRKERVVTPLNTIHNFVIMAIERGKLHHFIFDNQALLSHRMMAAILGVIIKLPPIQQALAREQVKSRYLEYLISKSKYR
ncbi:MAG: 4Fe-4S dicluster domain-containing protein [Desulfobacteraceae bacterium]|nr:MAG: 4Fe-4S dicluster domain-containing protein [Desulfobacteraceae bacterium]